MRLTERVNWFYALSQDKQIQYMTSHGYQYPLSNEDISDIWFYEIGEVEQIKEKAILMSNGIFDVYPKDKAAIKIRNFYNDILKSHIDGNTIVNFDVENWIEKNI